MKQKNGRKKKEEEATLAAKEVSMDAVVAAVSSKLDDTFTFFSGDNICTYPCLALAEVMLNVVMYGG